VRPVLLAAAHTRAAAQNGAIADCPAARTHRSTQEVSSLRLFEPVPCPDTTLLRAFDFDDTHGELGRQQPVVGHLGRELPNRGESDVDGRRREALRFEMTPVLLQNCF
jgi:hypothetical protein